MGKKVLVVEEEERHARELERLLASWGYAPVVHVAAFSEDIWDWVASHDFVGVVTYYQAYPVTGKRKELQEYVDCVKSGLPVLAIAADKPAGIYYFDSELHSTNDFAPAALRNLVAEHLAGTCAICAQYRS